MDLATMAAPLYFETIVVPAHLLAIGLFTAPFILLVVKQRNSARSSLLTLCGVAFAGIGFYISLVAIVRTFGATLLWGVAFVIVGFATIALTQLRRAKDQGLVEYLNLGNGVRKWLFQDTLLASLQEDQIVKTLTDLGSCALIRSLYCDTSHSMTTSSTACHHRSIIRTIFNHRKTKQKSHTASPHVGSGERQAPPHTPRHATPVACVFTADPHW